QRGHALDVLRLDGAADALPGEVVGVVLDLAVAPSLVAHGVDERLHAPELAVRVDAVQREGGAAPAALRAGELEVLRDLAGGQRITLVDLGEREAVDEVRNLARGLVLQPAVLRLDVVLALVGRRRVPELLRVVVPELLRIDGRDLEPVLPVLQALQDRIRKEVLSLLP